MSDLIDLRANITETTDNWLDAKSKATGKDRCQIVREALHGAAIIEIDEIILAYKTLQDKGLVKER